MVDLFFNSLTSLGVLGEAGARGEYLYTASHRFEFDEEFDLFSKFVLYLYAGLALIHSANELWF